MHVAEKSVLGVTPHGFHRVAYREWGDPDNERVVVCLHGLTRVGHDFDILAAALADRYRVVCPDLPGRGRSHWLAVPGDYVPAVYANDMAILIARLGVDEIDWVGTSLGGIVGMALAALPNTPIRRLVLNDIGPFIAKSALERISSYVGKNPLFADLDEAEAYLRDVHSTFGRLTDAEWAHITRSSVQHDPGSDGWRLHYDPDLAEPFRKGFGADDDRWAVWEQIQCPVLILRGEQSDILLHEAAEEMLVRGPSAELIEFPGVGHAPMLMDPIQVAAVREWLLR